GSGATAYSAPTSTIGIIVNASSTIGGATLGTGLTINGGATTTLLHLFQSGFISSASSTIGSGTQVGGLTISGGATTTGNSLVQGTQTISDSTVTGGTLLTLDGNLLTGAFISIPRAANLVSGSGIV